MKTLRQIAALVSMLLLLTLAFVVFAPVKINPMWAQRWAEWTISVLRGD